VDCGKKGSKVEMQPMIATIARVPNTMSKKSHNPTLLLVAHIYKIEDNNFANNITMGAIIGFRV